MPIAQVRATCKLHKRSLSIRGFPVVPAFGATVHGVQGETRDQIAVADLRPSDFTNIDRAALFVVFSRVHTRAGLRWIGRKPSPSDFEFLRPSARVVQEDERLRILASRTLQRIYHEGFIRSCKLNMGL